VRRIVSLKSKLVLFAVLALILPVLTILLFSGALIYKNDLLVHWTYLENIADLIVTDIKDTETDYLGFVSEFAEDEYMRTKLYVRDKYRSYLKDSTLAWDLVPLRDFVTNFSLTHRIETISIYESFSDAYKRILLLGNSTNVPYKFDKNIDEGRLRNLYYVQFLNCLYINFLRPVRSGDRITGLVLFQRAFDTQYFYNFTLKHDVDLAVVVNGTIIYSSSNGQHRESVQKLIDSNAERSYFRSRDMVFHMITRPIDFASGLSGAIVTISKGNTLLNTGGLQIIGLSVIGIASIATAVLLFYFWGLALVRSIHGLFVGANEVSLGNLEHKLAVNRKDELGALADNFNQMVRTIKLDKDNLEQKNRELRLLNDYIDAVFQSLEVNTLVVDRSYKPVLMNRSAKSKLKLPADCEVGDIFDIPFFKNQGPLFRRIIDEVLQTGGCRDTEEIEVDQTFYAVDLFPILDSESGITGVIIIIVNVTDRELLKRELLKSQMISAIGQISASLAHELNNPLGIIQNHVELLQSGKLSKKEQAVFLDRVHAEIIRINTLMDNLLQFSRNEMLEKRVIDLNELILQVFGIFSPILQAKGIRHEILDDTDSCSVEGNPTLLKQLFLNVVKNAVESIRHGDGRVEVKLSRTDGALVVGISDNGEGMIPSVAARIFDPFFTSKGHPNVGLGLPLCKEIARKHGGSIEVTSSESGGTTVTVTLPLRADE
jgi:signal transduction histidine kinase/HAMP domain-containing protein